MEAIVWALLGIAFLLGVFSSMIHSELVKIRRLLEGK